MIDGDEWKDRVRREEWDSPEMIHRDEYSSIMKAFYETVLRGLVQKGQKQVNRPAIEMTKSDLEWKINDPQFKRLPLQLQNAYQKFRELTIALEETSDTEILNFTEVLDGLFLLGINCDVYGHSISQKDSIYFKRDPCRGDKYKMNSAIRRAKEKSGDSKLLEALKGMFDVCRKCPYK